MGLLNKGICPICEVATNVSNKSAVKYNDEYICRECILKLGKQGINVFKIKNISIDELKSKIDGVSIDKISKPKKELKCPHCNSHNIELLANDKNYKTKYKTTVNLNPLKIFTLVNTKEIKKETSKKHNEYLCKNCGNRWIGK